MRGRERECGLGGAHLGVVVVVSGSVVIGAVVGAERIKGIARARRRLHLRLRLPRRRLLRGRRLGLRLALRRRRRGGGLLLRLSQRRIHLLFLDLRVLQPGARGPGDARDELACIGAEQRLLGDRRLEPSVAVV
jgi:hypothetical protein